MPGPVPLHRSLHPLTSVPAPARRPLGAA
jgi:hypothetical protein